MFAIERLHCPPGIIFTEVQTLTMPLPNETRHFQDELVINTGTQMDPKPELNVHNDECADDTTLCGGSEVPENLYGECINDTEGSYDCACMTGFTFEGDVCIGIDECVTGDHGGQPSAVCVNKNMGT